MPHPLPIIYQVIGSLTTLASASQAPSTADVAAGTQAVDRSSVAALAFLVWDICITFDDEVKLIWSRPWTYTKFLFYFVRYLPLMVEISILFVGTELSPQFHFSPHDCFIWQVYQGVASISIVASVDFILILRVYALFHNSPIVRSIVSVCFMLELAGMCTGLALSLPGIKYDSICIVTEVPSSLIIYGAASILFQTLLFSLTAYKFFRAIREGGGVPLITLLMRDGTWAFFVLFIVYVGQVSLYGLKNHALAGIFYSWLLTAFSFSGYRILLNIHHFSHHPSMSTQRTSTNIRFTSNIMPLSNGSTYNEPNSYELSPLSSTPTAYQPSSFASSVTR
ncbi:hypothetical protein BD779DRAFT_144646 [Infundibulicybe gibba]|nr:hypothetical protein BD779DRAFT_144646 [Infundibulicybe gibba]